MGAAQRFSDQIAEALITLALREDLGSGDLTSRALLPAAHRLRAVILAKQPGVVAGAAFCPRVFQMVDRRIRCTVLRRDGQLVRRGQAILRLEGPARSVLSAERTAVNILGHLCGVATLTRRFVQQARPYSTRLLDTRKTLPGLRVLEKYAVRMGGGHNHRMGLYDAVMIKTNHLRALHGLLPNHPSISEAIRTAVQRAKRRHPRRFLEVEVTTFAEFRAALAERPTAILLDNWSVPMMRRAVALRRATYGRARRPWLEASGNVTLQNIRRIAATRVERISIGRLTHSAPALDIALRVA